MWQALNSVDALLLAELLLLSVPVPLVDFLGAQVQHAGQLVDVVRAPVWILLEASL